MDLPLVIGSQLQHHHLAEVHHCQHVVCGQRTGEGHGYYGTKARIQVREVGSGEIVQPLLAISTDAVQHSTLHLKKDIPQNSILPEEIQKHPSLNLSEQIHVPLSHLHLLNM